MGIDAVQESLYYCLSPFNIIVLMLGESRLELSMVLLIIIKSACLPVTALYFFRHTNKKNIENGYSQTVATFIELACSMAYGLSGYVLAYGHNIIWLDGLILLPIVALGIEHLSDGKGWMLYTLSLAASIICNFILYMCVCRDIFLAGKTGKCQRFPMQRTFVCWLLGAICSTRRSGSDPCRTGGHESCVFGD